MMNGDNGLMFHESGVDKVGWERTLHKVATSKCRVPIGKSLKQNVPYLEDS